MKISLKDKFVCICGRRGSGKTNICMHLIDKSRSAFKEIFVISPSSFSGAWSGVVPDSNVRDKWSEQWMLQLIDRMTTRNKGKTQKSSDFTRVLVVLDDCLSSGDVKAHQSQALKIAVSRGRHIGLCLLNVVHAYKSISPMQRMNSDYILVGNQNSASLQILFEEFGIGDMDLKKFITFVRKNTADYRFLVIDNTAGNMQDASAVYATIKAPAPTK